MLSNDHHRLLKRQLKKTDLKKLEIPDFAKFLNLVNDAYHSFDKDIKHVENILEESSKELFVANQRLRNERDDTNIKLENLIDNVGGIIFETDENGNFIFLNSAWEEYSGFSIKESLGKSFKDFLDGINIEDNRAFKKLFSKKNKHIGFIFKQATEDGVMWFELNCKRIKDKDGLLTGYIGTIIDITDLKSTEIKLQKANKSKDEFLSTMSHEIRTPLNAVTGLANILLMEDHLSGQVENLKALKYSGEHLLGLINDLLDFDKINSGKIKINEKVFSLNQFLENINSHFTLRAQTKGLAFKMIEGGEDLKFIARRMLILASEDIGNANPTALVIANNTFQAVSTIGYPESRIILSQCATYLACSAKSNASYQAINKAQQLVKETGDLSVPLSIRNAPTKLMKELGYGDDYKYAHSYENNFEEQEFLPDEIKNTTLYEPGDNSRENKLRDYLKQLWKDKYSY